MTQAYNADNVSFGSPAVAGMLYRAPFGTALPTDATTALPSAFENVGYIGEKGIKNAIKTDKSEIKDASGATVLTQMTGFSETYQMVLLETMNAVAAKTAYGDDSVTSGSNGALTITHKMPKGNFTFVIEAKLNGGKLLRNVIPSATVSELGDRTMVGTDAYGYDVTLAANAWADYGGGTSREFIAAPATPQAGE